MLEQTEEMKLKRALFEPDVQELRTQLNAQRATPIVEGVFNFSSLFRSTCAGRLVALDVGTVACSQSLCSLYQNVSPAGHIIKISADHRTGGG
ncbi:hypothetical protein V5799_029316 [Amblyomma americanum]|uniref:Uncharacterized protein n=1 Tax=Amblyomma americanum TaxID=6943 RepID=A0AAQ4ERR2_AMBAM